MENKSNAFLLHKSSEETAGGHREFITRIFLKSGADNMVEMIIEEEEKNFYPGKSNTNFDKTYRVPLQALVDFFQRYPIP